MEQGSVEGCGEFTFFIDEGNVESQFPGELGLELPGLELNNGTRELIDAEEHQIEVEMIPADVEVDLPTDEREARTELPDAVPVMNPFHVVRVAGDGLDLWRQRIQQATLTHRPLGQSALLGPTDPAYRADLPADK